MGSWLKYVIQKPLFLFKKVKSISNGNLHEKHRIGSSNENTIHFLKIFDLMNYCMFIYLFTPDSNINFISSKKSKKEKILFFSIKY